MQFQARDHVLRLAIRAAVHKHRPGLLRELYAQQGEHRFAAALAGQAPRFVDDALSMLAVDERRALAARRSHPDRAARRPAWKIW